MPTYESGFSVLSQLILFRPFRDVLPGFESTSLSSREQPVSGGWVAITCETHKPKNADILERLLDGFGTTSKSLHHVSHRSTESAAFARWDNGDRHLPREVRAFGKKFSGVFTPTHAKFVILIFCDSTFGM